MDEESLFRDIHNHLIHQAQEGGKMDTEMKLAERFNVSRYRVRRCSTFSRGWGSSTVRRNADSPCLILSPRSFPKISVLS